jgi:DNA-binding NarL/FixJ family response regulator
MLTISIIEDNPTVRQGWEALIDAEPDMELAGAFSSVEDALVSPVLPKSRLIVMDIHLGNAMNGAAGALPVAEKCPDAAIVMCTVFDDDDLVFKALGNGAVGYLLKQTQGADFIRALREAAAGGSPMSPGIARKVIRSFQQKPPSEPQSALTAREIEVLELLAAGKSYHQIAQEIFLSVDGVRTRIRRIYEKLQAGNRAEAVAKGVAARLISFGTSGK